MHKILAAYFLVFAKCAAAGSIDNHRKNEHSPRMHPRFFLFLCIVSLCPILACQDLAEYRGAWKGDVEQSRLIRRGIDLCAQASLNIRELGSTRLDATLTLRMRPDAARCSAQVPGEGPVWQPGGESATLEIVPEILNDALADMTIEGDPLFTHVAWARFSDRTLLVFLSVFRHQRMEMRLVNPDLYAYFPLKKQNE